MEKASNYFINLIQIREVYEESIKLIIGAEGIEPGNKENIIKTIEKAIGQFDGFKKMEKALYELGIEYQTNKAKYQNQTQELQLCQQQYQHLETIMQTSAVDFQDILKEKDNIINQMMQREMELEQKLKDNLQRREVKKQSTIMSRLAMKNKQNDSYESNNNSIDENDEHELDQQVKKNKSILIKDEKSPTFNDRKQSRKTTQLQLQVQKIAGVDVKQEQNKSESQKEQSQDASNVNQNQSNTQTDQNLTNLQDINDSQEAQSKQGQKVEQKGKKGDKKSIKSRQMNNKNTSKSKEQQEKNKSVDANKKNEKSPEKKKSPSPSIHITQDKKQPKEEVKKQDARKNPRTQQKLQPPSQRPITKTSSPDKSFDKSMDKSDIGEQDSPSKKQTKMDESLPNSEGSNQQIFYQNSIHDESEESIQGQSDSDPEKQAKRRNKRVSLLLKQYGRLRKSKLGSIGRKGINPKLYMLYGYHRSFFKFYQNKESRKSERIRVRMQKQLIVSQQKQKIRQLNKRIKFLKDNSQKQPQFNKYTKKLIQTIFAEQMKQEEGYRIPFYIGVYDYFLHKYGFKQVAEKKIKTIYSYIKNHMNEQFKQEVFGQLCYMNGEMDETGYKLFLEAYKHFNLRELKTTELKINQEQLEDFSNGMLQNWLDQIQITQIMNSFKEYQTIDYYELIQKVIKYYFAKKNDYENTLKLLFSAADLDGNKLIEFSEVIIDFSIKMRQFKILYKALHFEAYDKPKALEQFLTYADFIDQNSQDRMMTLGKFTELGMECNIFSKEAVKKYYHGYENLQNQWEQEKHLIRYRYGIIMN